MPPPGYRKLIAASLPGTLSEIMAKSGMTEGTCKRWIRILREEGLSHITDWKRATGTRGGFRPVHAPGAGTDAANPLQPLTSAETCKRYRDKIKLDRDRNDRHKAKSLARQFARKAGRRGDPLVNALFGTRGGSRATPAEKI